MRKLKRTSFLEKRLLTALTLVLIVGVQAAQPLLGPKLKAADFTNRSVAVSSAVPLATANHNFSFTYISTSAVGSIVFEYCENSPLEDQPCTPPPGLDVSAAGLSSQSGNTGFSIDGGSTTANKLVLTRAASAASAVASTYNFSNITNPSTPGVTEFIRISTHASTDGTGLPIDSGSVAFATITPFNVATFVPPFMRICVGLIVAVDCSSAAGSSLNLGDFAPALAKSGQSQFAVGTNSISGYNVSLLGTTMTSGNNSIPALNSPTSSQPGTSQFGINLRANSNPSVGQEPNGSGTGSPAAGYDTANLFKFTAGDTIASAGTPTDFNQITVSYLVNISSFQPAGFYSTTLTYLATASF